VLLDIGESVGGGHLLDRPRMKFGWLVFGEHALLNLSDRREQVRILQLGWRKWFLTSPREGRYSRLISPYTQESGCGASHW
jgi:hypothetical protein